METFVYFSISCKTPNRKKITTAKVIKHNPIFLYECKYVHYASEMPTVHTKVFINLEPFFPQQTQKEGVAKSMFLYDVTE